MRVLLPLFFYLLSFHLLIANNSCRFNISERQSSALVEVTQLSGYKHRPNHLIRLIRKRLDHTRRGMAAALAFPLPFGVLALHRIYLGTQPHVPVAYIGTIGGVFGILPFIDFCVLVLDSDIQRFSDNGKVFMWIEK